MFTSNKTKYYESLGVPKNLLEPLLKPYPDTEKLKELRHPEKCNVYDDGKDAPEKIMAGAGAGDGESQPRRGNDIVKTLKVSLEDLYNGSPKKLKYTRIRKCLQCMGKGTKKPIKCSGCEGSGKDLNVINRFFRQPCKECRGTGERKVRCPNCKGYNVVLREKTVNMVLEKGMIDGYRIFLPGQADELPGVIPGDVVFILKQKAHPTFKRRYEDLFVVHKLSFPEAVCGFQFEITTLDGRKLLIKAVPGEVIKHGD